MLGVCGENRKGSCGVKIIVGFYFSREYLVVIFINNSPDSNFMVLPQESNDGMIDWGYDVFIGREIFDDGLEAFVTLSLQDRGACSYTSLVVACEELCDSVREGKSVLLYQGPGQAEAKYEPFKPEQMTLLQRLYAQKEEMKRFSNPFENQPLIH